MFFTYFGIGWGGGGASPKGLVRNLLMRIFSLDSQKKKFLNWFFWYCDHLK